MRSDLTPFQARELAWDDLVKSIPQPETEMPKPTEIQNEIKQEERSERWKTLFGKFLSMLGWIFFFPIFIIAT